MNFSKSMKVFKIVLLTIGVIVFNQIVINANEHLEIKIQNLIEKSVELDGKTVLIRGEVIGDVMPRKDHVWFNVQDETGVIGVWAPGTLAERILVTGDYEYKGDDVEVVGIFSRADRKLQGEICIRAEILDIIHRGYKADHPPVGVKIKFALMLSILCAILLIMRISIQKRN